MREKGVPGENGGRKKIERREMESEGFWRLELGTQVLTKSFTTFNPTITT